MSRRIRRWIITFSVIVITGGFMISLLAHFSRDISLSAWYDGAQGYVAAVAEQKRTGKPIALLFYTDWCSSCKKLKEDVLISPEVKKYINGILPVKVNPETNRAAKALADRFGVKGYPTFYVIPANSAQAVLINRTSNVTPEQFVNSCRQATKT